MLIVILLILPVVAGVIIAKVNSPETVAWVNNASAWWDRRYCAAKARGGGLFLGLWRALIWGFHKLHGATEGVADEAIRAGTRTASFFYIGGLSVLVIATVIYVAVVIALILFGLWVLFKIFGSDDSDSGSRGYTEPRSARGGTSRRRKGWLGDEYVEHLDEDGRPAGRSEVKKDWLGDEYVERRNADGDIVETSRDRKDWLGDDYVEHRDADGRRTGASRDRKDWLGDDYVEHRDKENRETGRSKRRRDWLGGSYTEHEPRD
jgi:hypothetical protein